MLSRGMFISYYGIEKSIFENEELKHCVILLSIFSVKKIGHRLKKLSQHNSGGTANPCKLHILTTPQILERRKHLAHSCAEREGWKSRSGRG